MFGALVFLASVCGCSAADGDLVASATGPEEGVEKSPDELVVGGVRYLKASLLTDADWAELRDPALWEEPDTVDKAAMRMRGHMLHAKYGEYMEAEPNYRAARVGFGLGPGSGDMIVDGVPQQVGRNITSNGDQRYKVTTASPVPFSAYAMFEAGGTGTLIKNATGKVAIYTAGHVIYNNATQVGADGFICRNNTVTTSSNSDACGGFGGGGIARWAFGGTQNSSGTQSWVAGFTSCGYRLAPAGWTQLPSNATQESRTSNDYAMQNLDGCLSSSVVPVSGTVITDVSLLSDIQTAQGGYAGRFTCPAGSFGDSTDCPTSGSQGVIQTTPDETSRPYTGGSVFWTAVQHGALISSGSGYWVLDLDITPGHSGGAAVAYSNNTWYAFGVASRGNTGGGAYFNRLTSSVWTWIFQ